MSDPILDRIKDALFQLVTAWTGRFDYGALYAATVKSQASDGTLGVVFDDARFPPADGIPVRLGLPGVTVKVSSGARVLIGFENQDPAKPRATLWDTTGLVELHVDPSVVTVFNGGTQKVARVGDSIKTGFLVGATAAGPVSFAIIPDADTAPPSFTDMSPNIQIPGSITSGSDKVKA